MAETLEVTTQDQPADMAEQKIYDPSFPWQRLALGGVMLISLFMNFYQLGQNGFGGNRGIGSNRGASVNTTLVSYLEANQGKATYLVATPSSHTADEIILTTNKPVMALGGFSGGDPILTTSQLASLVKNGTVRFFLLNSTGSGQQAPPQVLDRIPEQFRDRPGGGFGGGFGGGQQSSLTSWVTQHCTIVPASQWQSSAATTNNTPGSFGASQLYDCATTH